MSPSEIEALTRDVDADISRMARATQVRREVRDEIRFRAEHPMEEQLIDEDSFGVPRGEPRIIRVGNVELKVWKIHRAGSKATDIKGADLYYEISDAKYVLVQYKTPNGSGRIKKDQPQLSALRGACPNQCAPASRFSCGSWLALRASEQTSYHPACEADRIFASFASRHSTAFINGLTKEQFMIDFGQCLIGGRTQPIGLAAYTEASLGADNLFFYVQQRYL